jgi:Ferritin-like
MHANEKPAATGQRRLAEVIASRGGLAAPEAPFVIEQREALIYMLCEAAELEHAIMCQYLFAAFSLKQDQAERLTDEELEAVLRWRRLIFHVAAQEMLHLALVQNLLSAIGAAPHLDRPSLPTPAHHYPAGVKLTLLPFGEPALRHFLFLERPEGMELQGATGIDDAAVHDAVPLIAESDIVPQAQDFATIGHLYRSIEHGLARLAEKFGERNLFVGPPRAQATSAYFHWPELIPVTDLASAQQAIETIVEQGEGARGHWEDAHFGQFARILDEYRQMTTTNPDFQPARRVLFATVRTCGDESVPRIGAQLTSGCGDLFNVSYEILLQMLGRFFAHTEETDAQLATLANASLTLMLAAIKPLGDLLTTLPVGPDHPDLNAGPSFELFYESDYLFPHREAVWALLEERLRDAANFCRLLRQLAPDPIADQLAPVGDALTRTADSLAAHFGEWGAVSRFTTSPPPATSQRDREGVTSMQPIGFEEHVKTMFRPRDRESMKFAFDLWSYDDVTAHADDILARVRAGTMPCDGAWPTEQVATFQSWVDAGNPR